MTQSDRDILGADNKPKFSFDEFVDKNKTSIAIFLIGLILIGFGVFMYKGGYIGSGDKIEILNAGEVGNISDIPKQELVVEISGAVEKPGVYKLKMGDRIEDVLIASGGLSAEADREWAEKYINRAAKLTDGQKLYIVKVGEQSSEATANNSSGIKPDQGVLGVNSLGLVNINTSTLSELDTLPGIGQVYGQSIIDHRPYSSVEELLSKGALKQSVYDKIKDKVSTY